MDEITHGVGTYYEIFKKFIDKWQYNITLLLAF
jgi:hypothetical protein